MDSITDINPILDLLKSDSVEDVELGLIIARNQNVSLVPINTYFRDEARPDIWMIYHKYLSTEHKNWADYERVSWNNEEPAVQFFGKWKEDI